MVKRISRDASDVEFWVRFLVGALEMETGGMVVLSLARVWFSGRTPPCQGGDRVSITLTRTAKKSSGLDGVFACLLVVWSKVDKVVNSVDKGQVVFMESLKYTGNAPYL